MSARIDKINTLLAKESAALLNSEIEFAPDILVTVTQAKTSVDMRHATVFVSVLPAHKGPSTLAKIERHLPHIQHLLNRRLVLRRCPTIRVALDQGEQHASKIEKILAQEKHFGYGSHE
ncbi:MAG: ribosome-binding factor A [bacterium]|nr:ribosome-binding factor A [bacterium]